MDRGDSRCAEMIRHETSRSEQAGRTEPPEPARGPPTAGHEPSPETSDDAIKLAIKLAVDAGEYERASALLEVAKRTAKSAKVTPIDFGRSPARC
jgi:hypothetical protein